MKIQVLFRLALALMALSSIAPSVLATEFEATLRPISTSPSKDSPFVDPLVEVGFIFDRCIKLFDSPSVSVKCDGNVVATAISLDVVNHVGETVKQGTLIAKFDKQNLPKGKSYTFCLSKGSIGWEECYNDIQIVNPDYTFDVAVPENLGIPQTNLKDDSPVEDSSNIALCFKYRYEIAPVGSPEFLFYKNGELVGKVPVEVSYDWNLGHVRPKFAEKTNFDFGARYSLVLPAGSVSALHRSDIENEEFSLNFVGIYKEPDAPFSYKWCSLFTDHSDVLNEVCFIYDSPVSVTEGAVIELYEGDCETLVKSAPAYLNTDINCFAVCCNFGGFHMTSEKGYTVVVPDGAVYLQQFPDVKGIGGKIKLPETSGISDLTIQHKVDAQIYDLYGRVVKNPIPGTLYIKNGQKYIHNNR